MNHFGPIKKIWKQGSGNINNKSKIRKEPEEVGQDRNIRWARRHALELNAGS